MSPRERISHAISAVTHTSDATVRVARHFFHFWMAPLVDSYTGLSLNRFLAIVLTIAAVHGRFVDDKPLTAMDLCFAVLGASLAFGKSVFLSYLDRKKDASPTG